MTRAAPPQPAMRRNRSCHLAPNAMILIAFLHPFALASAQNHPQSAAQACPHGAEVRAARLYGRWDVFWLAKGTSAPASTPHGRLQLGPSAEHPDGLRGRFIEGGNEVLIAGDVDEDGELALEQSADGRRIDANWIGPFTEGSCAREVRGTWTRAADGTTRRFVLRQRSGW